MSEFVSRNYAPFDCVIVRGEGARVWDADGRELLDFLGAYSAVTHGHCHPRILATAHRQLDRVSVVARAFLNEPLLELAELLAKLSGLDRVMPMNSGAEAVESAIKVARAWGYRHKNVPAGMAEIIVCANNFHGRTTTIVGFSSEPNYRIPFAPATPGFVTIPFGDAGALERAITPNTVAFLVEPIQGEGGIVSPPPGWMAEVRAICTARGIALIWDEVQTGLGRTGKMFCFEHEDARPDLLVLGKALGGGVMPVSACVGRKELVDSILPGEHGSTFGGSPLAMAIATEALQTLVDEKLCERATELGATVRRFLADAAPAAVREVRGRGLLVGLALDPAHDAADLCKRLLARGVLVKETRQNVVRLAPPLVISDAELLRGLEITVATLGEL